MFIFEGPPEAFYEHVIERPPAAVHTDLDIRIQKGFRELGASKLSPLIRERGQSRNLVIKL